jgi:uncharacterized membrane protein YhhN
MAKLSSCTNYFLLIIPAILAILALSGFGFFFKSGTAGAGIIILILIYFKKLKYSGDIWMIIGAFLFSIAGDWFLSNMKGDSGMFVTGIALFFVAHVGYLSFALMNGKIKWILTGILLAAYLLFFFLKLYPSFDNSVLMAAVLIYLMISCLSLGAAVGIDAKPAVRWSYAFGIVMILFSDTIISFKEFVGYNEFNMLILPTYYLAHIGITFSLMTKIK